MLRWLARIVTHHPLPVIAGVVLLTLLAVSRIVDLRTGQPHLFLDPAVDALLSTGNEDRLYYDYFLRLFGSDAALILAVHREGGVFTTDTLAKVAALAERIEDMEGVKRVVALSNALHMRAKDGDLEIAPFFEEPPRTPEGLDGLRREVASNPIYAGNLVSEDGTTTAIVVYLRDMPEREFTQSQLDLRILALAEDMLGEGHVWLAGGPHLKAQTSRVLLADLARVVPLAFLLMAVIAFLSFRTLRGVLIPVSTILLALVWTLGMVAAGIGSLNLVTVVVPPLILVIGFAYAVHVMASYYDAVRATPPESRDGRGVTRRAVEHVGLPTFLTGVTTAAGFLSLCLSPLMAIKQFGVVATVGVLSTMIISLTWIPALLALQRPPPLLPEQEREPDWIDRMLVRLGDFDVRHRSLVLLGGAGLAVLGLYGMTRIEVSTDLVSNFDPRSEVRRHFAAVNDRLQGAGRIAVVLEADEKDAFKEPANLRAMEALEARLQALPEVGGVASLADYVRLINRGFHDGQAEYDRIPDNRRLVSQLLFFGANDEIDRFVDSQYRKTVLQVRTTTFDSDDMADLVARIEAELEGLPASLDARVTGNTVLVARTIDDIAYGQAVSLTSAFVVIFVILALLFTSFRIGLMALIPNALPVVVYFGALGLAGVGLSATTGLVACMVLGVAVDDTIHFLARFNADAKKGGDESAGVRSALIAVGRPVTYTSIALCLGFLILTTAELRNQVEFGALASFTLAVAWLVDLTFTVALASGLRIVTLWDVLALDLGRSPEHAIPLFRGLRRTQAKVAALMMDVVRHPEGHLLIREGDEGSDLYVVIEGELASFARRPDGSVVELNRHGRGDMVGEVGLLHGKRSADVTCESAVQLLRVEREDLERLRRRYPRTAATILQNLSELLASRLVAATARVG